MTPHCSPTPPPLRPAPVCAQCEWGLVSRDGWAVYEDTLSACTDANDWWSTDGLPPQPRNCTAPIANTDAASPARSSAFPDGATVASQGACCAACISDPSCTSWVYEPSAASPNCWPLAATGGTTGAADRVLGIVGGNAGPQFNVDKQDLYGFFHGHDFVGALGDYVQVGGKIAMVPKYASGVWWSRWLDLNNFDTRNIIDDYESRRLPLDVLVTDMNWHRKNDWYDRHPCPGCRRWVASAMRPSLAIRPHPPSPLGPVPVPASVLPPQVRLHV